MYDALVLASGIPVTTFFFLVAFAFVACAIRG